MSEVSTEVCDRLIYCNALRLEVDADVTGKDQSLDVEIIEAAGSSTALFAPRAI